MTDWKAAVPASMKWQLILWGAGVAIFSALSLVTDKMASMALSALLFFDVVLMFVAPVDGAKTFSTIFYWRRSRIIGGVLFVMVFYAVTISALYAVKLSGWENGYQKQQARQEALNVPKRKAVKDRIYALKSEGEAFKYVNEAVQRSKNKDGYMDSIGLSEYVELTDFFYRTMGRFSMQSTAEMVMMLGQYGRPDDGEYRAQVLSEIMVKDPVALVNAEIGVEERLLPEFKGGGFLQHPGCGLPESYYDEKTWLEREEAKSKIRSRLRSIMNDRNKKAVMYYIDKCFTAEDEE